MFKKVLCVGLLICMLLSLCSCKGTPDIPGNETAQDAPELISVMLGDKFLEEWNENIVVLNVAWNSLKLSGEDEAKFPKLKETFSKLNDEALTDAKALMYELQGAAKELGGGSEENPLYLEGETKVFVQRADAKIVSLLEGGFVYMGGVHPDYYYATSSYNPTTGEKIALADVLADTEGLPEILHKAITEKYDYIEFGEGFPKELFNQYAAEEYKWTLDYQGITFWFSPYDIASYAVGPLSVKIYFDENPDIFKKEYMADAPESYGIKLPMRQRIDFDLNPDDGEKDYVETDTSPDPYGGNYNMLSVTVNGKTVTDEIKYAYDFDVSLIRVGDKAYLYSESWSDSDYHMLDTWDLNGEEPKIVDELYDTQSYYEFVEAEEIRYKPIINNPEAFKLIKNFELLGTRGGWASFKANEATGVPEMTDEAYTFDWGHDLISKMPIKAEVLPNMEKEEISAGTTISPYQTDGKSYVDAKNEDGKIFRIKLDTSVKPTTVNGIPEEECFENIMYAG